jgi:tape measure domain-containing protein
MSYAALTADIRGNSSHLESQLDAMDARMRKMVRTNYSVPLRINTEQFGRDVSRVMAVTRRLANTKVVMGMDVRMNGVPVAEAAIRGLGEATRKTVSDLDKAHNEALKLNKAFNVLREANAQGFFPRTVKRTSTSGVVEESRRMAAAALVAQRLRREAESLGNFDFDKVLNANVGKGGRTPFDAVNAAMREHIRERKAANAEIAQSMKEFDTTIKAWAHNYDNNLQSTVAAERRANAERQGLFKQSSAVFNEWATDYDRAQKRAAASARETANETRIDMQKMIDGMASADRQMNDFFKRQATQGTKGLYFPGAKGPETHPMEEAPVRAAIAGGANVSDTVASARRAATQARNDLGDIDKRIAGASKVTTDFNTHLAKMRGLLDDVAASRSRMGRAFDDKLDAKVKRAANNLNDVSRNAKDSISWLDKVRLTLLSFGTSYLLISGIGDVFRSLKDAVFDFPAAMETATVGIQGILRTTREEAEGVLNELKQFAIPTPFDTQELVQAANQAIAFNLVSKNSATVGKELVSLMTDLGDASFGLGRGKEGVDRILLALGQMRVATRVMSQEMLQLQQVGINAWQYLAEGTGKTTAEVRKMVKDGIIPAEAAIKTIRAGLQRDFGGQMVRAADTLVGALAQIKDSFRVLVSDGTSPFYRELQYVTRQIAAFVGTQQFSQWLADTLRMAMDFARNVRAMATIVIDSIRSIDPATAKAALAFFAFFKAAEAILAVQRAIGALKIGLATLGGAQTFAALFSGGTLAGVLALAPALIALTAAVTAGYLAWDFYSQKVAKVAEAQRQLAENSQSLDKVMSEAMNFSTTDPHVTKTIIDLRRQMMLAGEDTEKLRAVIERITRVQHQVKVSNKLNNSAKALIEHDLAEAQRYAKARPVIVDAKMSAQSESFWQNFFQKLADATGMGQVTTDITQTAAYAGAGRIVDPIYNFFNPEGGNLVGDEHYEAQAALNRGSAYTKRLRAQAAAAQAAARNRAPQGGGTELFPGSNLFGVSRESVAAAANRPKTHAELLAAARANQPKPTALPKITPTAGTGKTSAEKAADKERARAMREENDRLADAAQLYDKMAKAAEDSARRQIESLNKVGDTMRDLFSTFQESLMRSGYQNNPLSQIISQVESLINLPGRVQEAARNGLAGIAENQRHSLQARMSQERNQGKDASIPAAERALAINTGATAKGASASGATATITVGKPTVSKVSAAEAEVIQGARQFVQWQRENMGKMVGGMRVGGSAPLPPERPTKSSAASEKVTEIPAQRYNVIGQNMINAVVRAVDTPMGKAACARFVSRAFDIMGVSKAIPRTAVAGDLVRGARRAGAREIPLSQAGPGDLIYQYGKNYGVMKDASGRGYHVGVGIGGGRMAAQNSRYVGKIWKNARALDTSDLQGGGYAGMGGGAMGGSGVTGDSIREMLANFNPNLSKFQALPREWTRLGGAVKDTQENTARFTAQMMLADRATTSLLRAKLGPQGFATLVKLIREAANETDRLNNLARGNEAAKTISEDIERERRLRDLNQRGIYGARADYVARRQDPKDPLHNAAPHVAMRTFNEVVRNSYEKAQQATHEMRVEQDIANRSFRAGLPLLRAATFNAYEYNKAVEQQAEKIRIRNALIKEGILGAELNREATAQFNVWRNGQEKAAGNARDVDWASHTQNLRDVNERTQRQLQTVNNLSLSETALNQALEKQGYYYEQIDRLTGLGHGPKRTAELAAYSARMWEQNQELQREIALRRELREMHREAGLTIQANAARQNVYATTQSGSLEQQRALANAASEAELQAKISRGDFNRSFGFGMFGRQIGRVTMRDQNAINQVRQSGQQVNESEINTRISENRSTNDLSARNQLLDNGLMLRLRELEAAHRLTDSMRQELTFQNEITKRKGTGNDVTQKEIEANENLLEVMRQIASIDFRTQMESLDDQLNSSRVFGKQRENMDWWRELERNPNLNGQQRQEIFDKKKLIRDVQETTQYIESAFNGMGEVIGQSLDKVVTTSGGAFTRIRTAVEGLVTGIADMLYKLAIQILQNWILNQVFGGLMNGLGGGGLNGLPAGTGAAMQQNNMGIGMGLSGLGSLFGFASGLDRVPKNGLAYIHRGETVLNTHAADMWRSSINYSRNSGGADNMYGGGARSKMSRGGYGGSSMNVGNQYVTVNFPGVTDRGNMQGVADEFTTQTGGGGGARNSRRTDAQTAAGVTNYGRKGQRGG